MLCPKSFNYYFIIRIRASCQRIGLVPGVPQRRHCTSVFHSLGIGFKSLGDFDHALNFLRLLLYLEISVSLFHSSSWPPLGLGRTGAF
jgi:hypothetical protein